MGRERRPDPASSLQALYAYQLHKQRAMAGLTQEQTGVEVHVSGKLIGHFETCRRLPSFQVSRDLDRLFGLDGYFEQLLPHVVNEAAIPSPYRPYREQENMAASIRAYEPLLVNGLLQTEAYARAVLSAGQRGDQIEQFVAARMSRQEILKRPDPPWLVILLEETLVRRVVGDPGVMREQHECLLDAMCEPNVTIQVIPANAPIYPSGAFTLLSFEEEPDVGYTDGAGAYGRLIEPANQVNDLAVLYDLIRAVALPVTESEKLIRTIMEDM